MAICETVPKNGHGDFSTTRAHNTQPRSHIVTTKQIRLQMVMKVDIETVKGDFRPAGLTTPKSYLTHSTKTDSLVNGLRRIVPGLSLLTRVTVGRIRRRSWQTNGIGPGQSARSPVGLVHTVQPQFLRSETQCHCDE